MAVNALHKFGLLMWKNWLLEIRHKWILFFECALPLFFLGQILAMRVLVDETRHHNTTIYQSFPAENQYVGYNIIFAPMNPQVEEIVMKVFNQILSPSTEPIGFNSSKEMLDFLIDREDSLAIDFTDNFPKDGTTYPEKLKFTLRFPSVNRQCRGTWQTDKLFPDMGYDKPREIYDYEANPCYNTEGFLTLQSLISRSFIELKSVSKGISIPVPEIQMQRFPYPSYVDDLFIEIVGYSLSIMILLCFVSPFGVLVKQITGEKENQQKEVMKMMGLDNWLHWTAWFTKSMIFLIAISILAVVLFKIPLNSDDIKVLNYTDGSVLFVILVVYSIATTAFAMMTAVFFSKANTAQAVSILLFFLTFIPYYTIDASYYTTPFGPKIGISFLFNSALAIFVKLLLKLEASTVGLQWSNLFEPVSIDDDMSIGILLLMMLVDTAIYLLIGLYVERIFPGEYGVPDPWYFPFTKRFWCGSNADDECDVLDMAKVQNAQNFEPGPDDKNPGIKIRGLRKVYGKNKVAVSGLTMDMYEDHITALLGHNGAGKTTTMSMLTGLFPPSSGTAVINGCDIRTNINGVRASLGLCPQKNVVFNDLTVGEHLKFYCSLKGLNRRQTQEEISKYLGLLDLSNKLDSLSSQLSGGMKRKLCVAIALCGSSKVVLLDEPTSGMDPAARRNLWNLLQEDKKGRTILLSTHFMDEADILGDRIAILSHGDLKACGSSFYLKKRYGVGYHLICEKKQGCNVNNVTKLLQRYIPNLEIENNVGSELSYNLPEESVAIFQQMLKDLEDNSENLELSGYGISPTTLEEVFMRVEAEMMRESKEDKHEENGESKDIEAVTLKDYDVDSSKLLRGPRLHVAQWAAMFTKKFYYTIRNWLMLLIHILIPVGVLVLSALSIRVGNALKPLPPLEIDLSVYGPTTTILQNISAPELMVKFEEQYQEMFGTFENQKLQVINEDFQDYILRLGKTIQPEINRKYMVAASSDGENITSWFNNQAFHTPPISLNLVYNALARAILGFTHSIEVTNAPLPFTKEYINRKMNESATFGFIISFNIGFGMCFVSTFFALFAIKERVSRAKLLQFVSGINIFTFWITSFLWDFVFFLGIISVVTVTFAILQSDGFSTTEEIGRIFLVLMLFAYAAIPLTYLFSFLFSDSATGYGKIAVIYIFLGPAAFLLVFVLDMIVIKTQGNTLAWYFRIIPHFSMSNALNNLYIMSSLPGAPGNDNGKGMSPFAFEKPGIGGDLAFLAFDGLLYMAILFLIEFGIFNELVYKIIRQFSRRVARVMTDIEDDDVTAEKKLVANMSMTEIQSKNLVLRDVSKYYKNFLAVNKVSVSIQKAECFGLLGVNGAGKTSTFKMLTGDESISSGDIYVQGIDLKKSMSTVYKHIGYCPQFDALIEDLSGRETIRIYCLLRGVPSSQINSIIMELGKNLGFYEHIDKRIKEYSGGTKRKLSAALALIGGPDIIYLDEPTTGMDPKSRRKLWDVICKIRDSGRTIVLTSHSMEECEALCTRLAIMVNGEFKCIGSRQHLKNKFSKGLLLIIKVRKPHKEVDPHDAHVVLTNFTNTVIKVKEFVSSHFPESLLRDEYKELLTFFIPQTSIKWSSIFGLLQSNKDVLDIEDYSISQTTLEQIFLEFAKNQIQKI